MGVTPAAPIYGEGGAVSPAAPVAVPPTAPPAAPPRAAVPPAGVIPPKMITYRGQQMTLADAKEHLSDLDFLGIKDTQLAKDIEREEKDTDVPPAIKQAAIQADQSYRMLFASLDRYNNAIQAAEKQGQFTWAGGFTGASTPERDAAKEELNNIILLMKEMYGLGQISEGDRELAANLPPVDAGWLPTGGKAPRNVAERTQASVDRFKERILHTRNVKAEAVGLPKLGSFAGETKTEAAEQPKYGPEFTDTINGKKVKFRRNLTTGKLQKLED